MQPGSPPSPQGITPEFPTRTYDHFTAFKATTVEKVLQKCRAFGFRETDVFLGLKKQIPPADASDHYFDEGKGMKFSLEKVSIAYSNKRVDEVMKTYFYRAGCEKSKSKRQDALEDAGNKVMHFFNYDAFINKYAEYIIDYTKFSNFIQDMEAIDDKEDCFSPLLREIANGMHSQPEFDPCKNPHYISAMWVELSNALAMNKSDRQKAYTEDCPIQWQSFLTQTNREKRKPVDEPDAPECSGEKQRRISTDSTSSSVEIIEIDSDLEESIVFTEEPDTPQPPQTPLSIHSDDDSEVSSESKTTDNPQNEDHEGVQSLSPALVCTLNDDNDSLHSFHSHGFSPCLDDSQEQLEACFTELIDERSNTCQAKSAMSLLQPTAPPDLAQTFALKDFQNLQETLQVVERQSPASNYDQYTFIKRNSRTPSDQSPQPTQPKHTRIPETIVSPPQAEERAKIEPTNSASASIQSSIFTQENVAAPDPKTTVDSDKPDPAESHSEKQQGNDQIYSDDASDEENIDLFCRESPFSDPVFLLHEALSKSRNEHQQYGESLSYRKLRESMMPTADTLNCATTLIEFHNQPAAGQKIESTKNLYPIRGVEYQVSTTVKGLDPGTATISQTSAVPATEPRQQMSSGKKAEYNSHLPFILQYRQKELQYQQKETERKREQKKERERAKRREKEIEKDRYIKEISNLTSQLHQKIVLLNQSLGEKRRIKETEKMDILNKLQSATTEFKSIKAKKG